MITAAGHRPGCADPCRGSIVWLGQWIVLSWGGLLWWGGGLFDTMVLCNRCVLLVRIRTRTPQGAGRSKTSMGQGD